MPRVLEYLALDGRSPFGEWRVSLDAGTAVKIDAALYRMATGNLGDCKPVGQGVTERRIDHGPGYRVYFGRHGAELVILLAGGTKRRQAADIATAQERWADYKRRRR